MDMKKCTKCGEEKPRNEEYFHKQNSKRDGLRSHCKSCRSQAKLRPEPRDGYKFCYKCGLEFEANKNNFFSDNSAKDGLTTFCKKCKSEACKEWRNKNYEKVRQYSRKWQELHPEKKKQSSRDYSNRNRGKLNQWAINNPERAREIKRQYKLRNPDRGRQDTAKRRSLERKLPTTYTMEQWKGCKAHFKSSCAYCGKELKKLHQEHFVPVTKGGGYTINNIVPACQRCNSSKNNSDFFEWYPKQKFFSKQRQAKVLKYLGYISETEQQTSIFEMI